MKHLIYSLLFSACILFACENKKSELVTELTIDTLASGTTKGLDSTIADEVTHIEVLKPDTKTIDSLLKKPVTTPANNPFGLKSGDKLIPALAKDPLKERMKTILGDKYAEYVKFLATAKPLKKDSDGFLYTQGAASAGSKNEAFFLYHHENDVLFLGFQKGTERVMLNDMKSRMFAPQKVDDWVERPVIE
ncbi:hypothetical protein [uncultured Cytophaga sp.]|uniref:hypothetical protein n=1 Tax=uncultured Cytophaga sp. TaxID=160238 RepID=UPI00260FD2E9|nr:hypothetical protein [uncultured Cytophaga sp.]